jgi:predicted small lipoprotein YifL
LILKKIRIAVVAAILLVFICGVAGCGKKGEPAPKNPFQQYDAGR